MSRSRPQHGNRPKEQVKPVNPEIRQYFDPDLPIYGPWRLWQTKPELPSSEEIMGTDVPGDVVALTANCISGPWISKEKYLEAHYSLIREDLVAPLRNAVAYVRDNPSMKDTADVSIYEKVNNPFPLHFISHHSYTSFLIKGLHCWCYPSPIGLGVPPPILHSPRGQEHFLGILQPSYSWNNCRPNP